MESRFHEQAGMIDRSTPPRRITHHSSGILPPSIPFCLEHGFVGVNDRYALIKDLSQGINSDLNSQLIVDAQRARLAAQADVDELSAQVPWLSATPPDLEIKLSEARERLHAVTVQYNNVKENIEVLKTHKRALTPLFSTSAVNEVRQLWADCQSRHARTSAELWAWDTVFNGLQDLTRNDDDDNSLASIFISSVVHLLFRIAVGSFLAIIEFLARLPFWIREYETASPEHYSAILQQLELSFNSTQSTAVGKVDHATRHIWLMEIPRPRVGFFRSGITGFLKAILFYCFAVISCLSAFLLQIIVFFVVVALLFQFCRRGDDTNKDD